MGACGLTVATLWHWYQPPWQSDFWVERIARECYLPVSRWLSSQGAQSDSFHAAINIPFSLTEHLSRLHLTEVMDNLGCAAESGVVEFTGCAAYHALLPGLLSQPYGRDEARRQIDLNDQGNRSVFGELWQPRGFFPPEMAFSQELAALLAESGFSWTMADSVCYDSRNSDTIPHNDLGTVSALPVFFRSGWSNEFSMARPGRSDYDARRYVSDLASSCSSWFGDTPGYFCLAYDVETIGHHIHQYTTRTLDDYVQACAERSVTLGHFSALADRLQRREVSVSSGSWSTSLNDIAQGEHFPLWQHSQNAVHRVLAEMTSLAISAVHEGIPDDEARRSLDKGLHSCKEWWANRCGKWNPDAVRSGFSLLETAAVRSRPDRAAKAEALRLRLDGLLS